MAFSYPAIAATICTSAACFPFCPPPSAVQYPHLFLNKSPLSTTKKHSAKSSCKAKDSSENNRKIDADEKENQGLIVERRGFLLIGLGSTGIYETAANLGISSSVSPDYLNCVDAAKPDGAAINCCPTSPAGMEITDYIPSPTATTRVRQPAHTASGRDNMVKYRKAVELMKQLPTSDPRSFMQQADVHCAYCNGGYKQKGYSNVSFQVHRSWLFFPFHRWYLYFFERICGKLLQDDTFALPFWNYDSPSGMQIPAMFNESSSPLYDRLRNQDHLPPVVVDLNWGSRVTGISPDKNQINYNLNLMYKQMITNATTPRLFMGQPYRAGDEYPTSSGSGSIEIAPHIPVHAWTGDPKQPFMENMGTFYAAARDPIFYAHHANIDRLWNIWVNNLGGKLFSDPDWLESSFVFYNEEAKPVTVKVKDCLDSTRLGYVYEDIDIPWLDAKPTPRRRGVRIVAISQATQVFPTALDRVLDIIVTRPKKLRSKEKKEEAEEVLLIDGIEYDFSKQVKFDVYLNECDVELSTPANTEFLGSFVDVPYHKHPTSMEKGSVRFPLSSVLKELQGSDEISGIVMVTLVPQCGDVTIGSVMIEFDTSKSSG